MKNLRKLSLLMAALIAITSCKKTEEAKKTPVNSVDDILKRAAIVVEGTSQYRAQVATAVVAGRVVQIAGETDADGAGLQQWDWLNTNFQKWTASRAPDNHLKIINIGSGKLLTSTDNNPGSQLKQMAANGTDAQLWKMKNAEPAGFYHFINKNGLYGSLKLAESGNGAIVTQETEDGSDGQKWFVQRLFKNPLKKAVADPWVYQRNGMYYFLATTGYNITLYKTEKMSGLKSAVGKVVWTPPSGQMYSNNIWAPEMHYLDGKWYIYFAGDNGNDGNHRMHVLENAAEDPTTGTWIYKGKISDPSDIWAIDGSVFDHSNGKRYFMWSGWRIQNGSQSGIQQIYIAEMSNPWTITGDRHMISEPTYSWEKNGLVNEGPEILKNANGDVFLVYSASGCWTDDYKLGMMKLTGDDPLQQASWAKYADPVFQKSVANSVYAPGHNSFFKSPNGTEDWIIYHANEQAGQGCGGSRNTRMQKFTWNDDGTPNFGIPKAITESLPVPSGEPL